MKTRTNKILLALFLLLLAVYVFLFADCFSQLPINPTPLQQGLVLHLHGIPMFLIQLLLYRLSKPWWWHLVPVLPMLVVGLGFMSFAEWYILGWILVAWWCAAPAIVRSFRCFPLSPPSPCSVRPSACSSWSSAGAPSKRSGWLRRCCSERAFCGAGSIWSSTATGTLCWAFWLCAPASLA